MTTVPLGGSGFLAPPLPPPRGADSSDENSGSWSDQDLALALPPDPDPNPAGQGPDSAAAVLSDAAEMFLQPAHGSPFAGDDLEQEQEEDGWEVCAPHRSTAKRLKRPCDGDSVSKGKRLRIGECGSDGGGGGNDEAVLPGPSDLGRPAPGGCGETAALGSHRATPEQARTSKL